jgi:hypothetical protein
MKRFDLRLLVMAYIALLSLVGTVGCAHHETFIERIQNDPTLDADDREHQIRAAEGKISMDPTLTDAEKQQKLRELGVAVGGVGISPEYLTSATILALGLVLLTTVTTAKRRKEAASQPARRPQGSKTSKPSAGTFTMSPGSTRPGSPVGTVSSSVVAQPPQPAPERLPENQAEVDAMPYDTRGASFFTSRPLPSDKLIITKIRVGEFEHRVVATRQEADKIEAGNMPLVRAYTIGDVTAPWYEWSEYNPFDHYWAAMDGDLRIDGKRAIGCWMPLDKCNPRLTGYYKSSKDDRETANSSQ